MTQRTSVLEQVSASAGSFVFFILAARFLGPTDYGLFALHLVAAQIVHSVAVQWLLLPITTTPGRRPPRHLLNTVARRLAVLIAATPLFALIYSAAAGFDNALPIFVALVTLLFTALVLFDVARYFAIRLDRAGVQVACNAVRWLVSFSVVLAGFLWPYSGPMLAATAFVGGIFASLLVSTVPILRDMRSDLENLDPASDIDKRADGNALLSLGLANAVFTLVSSSALARASLAAFGAIQAFRSLVNWAPLILQYLETHFASSLAREDKTAFTNVRWLLAFLFAGVLGEFVIFFAGEWILTMTVGAEFVHFLWLFGIMFALVLVQSYTRTVGIEVRLSGAIPAIWMQSALLVAGAVLIGGWMSASEFGISTYTVISIMVATAVLQAVAMTLGLRIHRSRAQRS
jgi:hypothetical protein